MEKLLYSDWFTACFVEQATNAAMWGVYGDRHQGVALKFRTQDSKGQPALVLNRITGIDGSKDGTTRTVRSDVPHILHQVHYQQRFANIDFFQTIGRITGAESRFWHFDEAGNQSPRSLAAEFGSDAWRNRYWSALTTALTTKHEDWAHEHERRIILHGGFIDFGATKENRKLVYRFEALEGIVFGGKTPAARVMEIVRVIREKCRKAGRSNFEFLRAEYSPHEGKMTLLPLSLLKLG